uniref:Nudix hydrolase domain-containing protein n=1 Tax=Phaeomonas parva TaxID=124430 RepID=A0A6U4D5W0_9STRA
MVDFTAEGEAPDVEDSGVFLEQLSRTIGELQGLEMKSAWIKLPIAKAGLAAVASEEGFQFHHAKGDYAVLYKWLRPGEEDKVPPFATHQVGCAGFVLNKKGEILVVKEFHGTERVRKPARQWKLPGGMLDLGESFGEAATREVFEETGVRTNFSSVLCFWHRHGLTWGKSDLYVVTRLEAETEEINVDPTEISECRWMPLQEFVETQDHPLILTTLANLWGVRKGEAFPENLEIVPQQELKEVSVQWPGRPGYPTYYPTPGS